MKLTEEIKNKIIEEFVDFKNQMYAGKSKEERQKLDQFFTPPNLTMTILEEYPADNFSGKIILDPTSGSGNLLAAALIAGADSDKVFGNELDSVMVKLCRERLNKVCDSLGKPHIHDWQIHQGNALISDCITDFGPEYDNVILEKLTKNNNKLLYDPETYKKEQKQKEMYGPGFFD